MRQLGKIIHVQAPRLHFFGPAEVYELLRLWQFDGDFLHELLGLNGPDVDAFLPEALIIVVGVAVRSPLHTMLSLQ